MAKVPALGKHQVVENHSYFRHQRANIMWIFVEDKFYASVQDNDQQDGAPVIVLGDYEKEHFMTLSFKTIKEVVRQFEHQQKDKERKRKRSRQGEEEKSTKRAKIDDVDTVKSTENEKEGGIRRSGFMSRKPNHLKLKIPPRTTKTFLVDEVEMMERQRHIHENLLSIYAGKIEVEINRLMKERCFGCINNCPSQKDHDLCIETSYSELVDMFLDEAKSKVDLFDVQQQWYKTLANINNPPMTDAEIIQCKNAGWLQTIENEQLKMTLTKHV
ncbi:hypothetical protein AC249_AIPGENE24143 [Exaiptasia diaphana]|nr:hypothetical protein AC249_AIPGENE24143 [Exaiptasia diaphana]